MIMILRMLLAMEIMGFAFLAKTASYLSPTWIENSSPAPGTLDYGTRKSTASLLDYVDADVKKTVLEEDVIAFELGLCWEDGYHVHRTEDPELIKQIVSKVQELEIRLNTASDAAACDAGYELIFVTKDGKKMIPLNDWRLEIRGDHNAVFYELENDDGLWELCHQVYVNGTLVDD